jgi:hypothetical protein
MAGAGLRYPSTGPAILCQIKTVRTTVVIVVPALTLYVAVLCRHGTTREGTAVFRIQPGPTDAIG